MSAASGPAETGAPTWLRAAAAGLAGRLRREWRATPIYAASLDRPRTTGVGVEARDRRPADPALGSAVRAGRFAFPQGVLDVGPQGDPWDRPSPSRATAVQLHRFAWLPSLLEQEGGPEAALRLILAWRTGFDRPSAFAWSDEVLERRVFNFACGLPDVLGPASEREQEALVRLLARQARALAASSGGPARRAERWAAVSIAGCVLAGRAGDRLLDRALPRLGRALADQVRGDGGLRTRSPEQGLELWFDLASLDEALERRGRRAPAELAGAMDRLEGATRFFRLTDGGLAAFHGGGASTPARVAAARSAGAPELGAPYQAAPHSGFHRLEGRRLTLLVDAAAPPAEAWSVAACPQPAAFEASADGERLVVGSGWTPDAAAPEGLRLSTAASTLTIGEGSPGRPLTGGDARALGPRLRGAPASVVATRSGNEAGVLLELEHDGWAPAFGLTHLRRLFLDTARDELRGEDRLTATDPGRSPKIAPAAVRFHLAPGVKASIARDGRSVLLRTAGDRAWWLRNDAAQVRLEPSVRVTEGAARAATQVVLHAPVSAEGARVRWKLSPVDAGPARVAPAAAPDLLAASSSRS